MSIINEIFVKNVIKIKTDRAEALPVRGTY